MYLYMYVTNRFYVINVFITYMVIYLYIICIHIPCFRLITLTSLGALKSYYEMSTHKATCVDNILNRTQITPLKLKKKLQVGIYYLLYTHIIYPHNFTILL